MTAMAGKTRKKKTKSREKAEQKHKVSRRKVTTRIEIARR